MASNNSEKPGRHAQKAPIVLPELHFEEDDESNDKQNDNSDDEEEEAEKDTVINQEEREVSIIQTAEPESLAAHQDYRASSNNENEIIAVIHQKPKGKKEKKKKTKKKLTQSTPGAVQERTVPLPAASDIGLTQNFPNDKFRSNHHTNITGPIVTGVPAVKQTTAPTLPAASSSSAGLGNNKLPAKFRPLAGAQEQQQQLIVVGAHPQNANDRLSDNYLPRRETPAVVISQEEAETSHSIMRDSINPNNVGGRQGSAPLLEAQLVGPDEEDEASNGGGGYTLVITAVPMNSKWKWYIASTICIVLIVVVAISVTVGVVLGNNNDDNPPAPSLSPSTISDPRPTMSPSAPTTVVEVLTSASTEGPTSLSPTQAPTVEFCYNNTDAIFVDISNDDIFFQQKRYVICPNTVIDLGFIVPGVGVAKGETPLVARSNTEFLCGQDGKVENNCTLRGGDFAVLAVPVFFTQDINVNNVVIRGFTFEGQEQYSIFVATPGDVTVIDCIFKNQVNFGPVVFSYDFSFRRRLLKEEANSHIRNSWDTTLDYIEALQEYHNMEWKRQQFTTPTAYERSQTPEDERDLQTTKIFGSFRNCLFTQNQQIERQAGVENGVVTIRGPDNIVELESCTFVDNDYGDIGVANQGYAILVSEGVAAIQKCCFLNNSFAGGAPIILERTTDPSRILRDNYATYDDGVVCELAAYFETENDLANFNYTCVESQTTECESDVT